MSEAKLVKFKINGQEIEAPAGTMVIKAAHEAGIDVPHFCYHPGLTPDGNCRMCLVEASNARKPVASCVTPVAEGLEITTDSDTVKEAREGVLELMLLNHPLDCPICDKSGECMLQDNVYDHGPDNSRMTEPKMMKPTKDLGSTVALWGNRCIVCQRCTRFCEEVSGTGELAIIHRGDSSVVDVFPGYPLENDLSLNTVDICPVGALISKDFLYEARVWNMKDTPSICTGCSKGCNVEIQQERNQTRRIVPRHNPEVNDYWMCDEGREVFKPAVSEDRLLDYQLRTADGTIDTNPKNAASAIFNGLNQVSANHGTQAIAGIGSAFMSCEELYVFKLLFDGLQTPHLGAFSRPQREAKSFKQFEIPGDPNPNRLGVERILGREALEENLEKILSGIQNQSIRGALIFDDLLDWDLPAEWQSALSQLEFLAIFSLRDRTHLPQHSCLLPATTFGEKDGSMLNGEGRLQRLRIATQLPRTIRYEHEILQQMQQELGMRSKVVPPSALFKEMGKAVWPQLEISTIRELGDQGIQVESPTENPQRATVS